MDDASVGFFRYGPTEDVWRVCRPGEAHCARNNRHTAHMTSSPGAFVEFMTIAKKIEYIGRVSSPVSSPSSSIAHIQVTVDDQIETLVLSSTPREGESRVLWSKTFDDDREEEGDMLRTVRITNVDGELELDYIAETMNLPSSSGPGALKDGAKRPPWLLS